MPAPAEILELVARFERNREAYQSDQYNETQLRREFLDPMFEVLGWDVLNRQGNAEPYKDVVHEDAIRIAGTTKAPDYSFRVGSRRIFFLEAKRPSIDLKTDARSAHQLRCYAWSATLPLSVLSNFAQFAAYDGRIKPDENHKASIARILLLDYTDYDGQWEKIASVFSRDAVYKGSFDKFAESNKSKRGTTEVDAAFLREIEGWRDELARNIGLRNPELSSRDLNYAVQATIDRIVFLRICEDRGIETYGRLRDLQNGESVYRRMCQLFERADERYNSGLFHFTPEKDRDDPPDELTLRLSIDDKPLKDLIRKLYYPASPYVFSVIPAEILGQVYEQFLGKVIRLTPSHQVKIEEKPEVKKAGGVFYTPPYIVEHIVHNTIGPLLEEKTPKQAAAVRIVDPACGSGSFLIGAYQYLLDWYLKWYVEHDPPSWAKKKSPPIFQTRGPRLPSQESEPAWRLTSNERKRILLDNIYGVDIDPQAVEVTKLSLLLKVLEGESSETIDNQLRLLHERALPDLAGNVKCGNSLIDRDLYANRQMNFLDEEEQYRINVFDWKAAFPHVFRSAGGFDAAIGNPPYIRIQSLKEFAPIEVEYYKSKYRAASRGNYDIYVVFVERGLGLLNPSGRLGFILPHKFFNAKYGEPLRGIISAGKHLHQVVHFGDQQVFTGATTYTCLMFLTKAPTKSCWFQKIDNLEQWRSDRRSISGMVPAERITTNEWNFVIGNGAALFEKLKNVPSKLGDVAARMGQGIRTSANEVFVLDVLSSTTNQFTALSETLAVKVKLERSAVRAFLQGREIKRYRIRPCNKVVILPYRVQDGDAELIPESQLQSKWPKTYEYLRQNKKHLQRREKNRFRGPRWYIYGRTQNIDLMLLPKILVPDIADRASFALDERGEFAFTSGYGITLGSGVVESPKYVLGLLNSKVLDFFLKRISTTMRGGFFRYFTQYIEQLPIRRIDFTDRKDKTRHDDVSSLVERMLLLHRQLDDAKTPDQKTRLGRQIDATDREIDQIVYELYDLTPEEIRIVEDSDAR